MDENHGDFPADSSTNNNQADWRRGTISKVADDAIRRPSSSRVVFPENAGG
jgi:hypothetical protein